MNFPNKNVNNDFNFMYNNNNDFPQNMQMQLNQNNFNPFFPQGMNQINPQINMINNNMNLINQMNKPIVIQSGKNENEFRSKKDIKFYDFNYITDKQRYLINAIIDFNQKNGNIYMNFDNPLQIIYTLNFIDAKKDDCRYDNQKKIEDPLYYIKEPKKIINFINTDYIIYKVNIPRNITKYDLYTIANKYIPNKNVSTKVLLIYNDTVLNSGETPIDSISDNSFIKIIDVRNYPDGSYYNFLRSIKTNKTNFSFIFDNGNKQLLALPSDIKINQLLKAFYLKNGFEPNNYRVIYNTLKLSHYDENKLNKSNPQNISIYVNEIMNYPYTFGKIVTVHISYFNEKIHHWIFDIGLLNSIHYIISKVETFHRRRVKILVIGNLNIKRNDERTLLSLGIKSNFHCKIDFE